MNEKITQLVRPNILELEPYRSARSEGMAQGALMDANENPFSPLGRYPDPYATKVRQALAEYVGVAPEMIFTGNGSDEIIDLLIRIFCEPGQDAIYAKSPTYGVYGVMAAVNNVAVTEEISERVKLIFLCSPNNPTGEMVQQEELEKMCGENAIVVVDEAYIEFSAKDSFVEMLARFSNLVILRTLSKAWGAAAIRLGYAICSGDIVSLLDRVKYPYNINALTQEAALEILANRERMESECDLLLSERERMRKELAEMGFKVWPSEGNFFLAEFDDPVGVQRFLREREVVVRDRSGEVPGCLRISVGTPEENNQLISLIKELCDQQ